MKNNSGFTLIELIIVIAILAVISAIAVPNIIFAVDNARISADITNAKVIADSIQYVISKDNDINRVDFTDVEFEANVTGQSVAVERLIEGAAVYIQSVPTVKYGSLRGDNFIVSVGGSTGILIKIGTDEIYPTPSGEWEKQK